MTFSTEDGFALVPYAKWQTPEIKQVGHAYYTHMISGPLKINYIYNADQRFGIEYEIPNFFTLDDHFVPISNFHRTAKSTEVNAEIYKTIEDAVAQQLNSKELSLWRRALKIINHHLTDATEDMTMSLEKELNKFDSSKVKHMAISVQAGRCSKPCTELRTPPGDNLTEAYDWLHNLIGDIVEQSENAFLSPLATYQAKKRFEGAGFHVHISPKHPKLVKKAIKQYIPILLGISASSIDPNSPMDYHSLRNVYRAAYWGMDGKCKHRTTLKQELNDNFFRRGTLEVTLFDTPASLKDGITFASLVYALSETIDNETSMAKVIARDIGSEFISNAILEAERIETAVKGPGRLWQLTDDYHKIENLLGKHFLKELYDKGILFDWMLKSGFVEETSYDEHFKIFYDAISPELKAHEAPPFVLHILDDFRNRFHCAADSQQEISNGAEDSAQQVLIEKNAEILEKNSSLIMGET